MKKIPTVFLRAQYSQIDANMHVSRRVHPDCYWVIDGHGVARRKYDGTSCLFDGVEWWKRREVKRGNEFPTNFMLVDKDEITGKMVGWVPFEDTDKWHHEGARNAAYWIGSMNLVVPGTYELCGPKIQGNPEGYDRHLMVRHATAPAMDIPRHWDGMNEWLANHSVWEGVVFHNSDGRMAKIKRRDFGHGRD